MFDRFTRDARAVITSAQQESRRRNDPHIGTEHLLLGLSRARDLQDALDDARFDAESARKQLEVTSPAASIPATGHIPFTPRAKQVLEESLRVMKRLEQVHIAPPHLLRALLGLRFGGGVSLLVALGVDVDALTIQAEKLAAGSESDSRPLESQG